MWKKVSGHKAAHGESMYLYIQCEKCGEKLKVLVKKETDLERVYEEEKGGPAYRLIKEAMDSKCFSIITIRAEFDINKNIISRDISNGHFITEEDYPS
jgi:DNA-directed RNA polymerase subunit RPC12/RpoP